MEHKHSYRDIIPLYAWITKTIKSCMHIIVLSQVAQTCSLFSAPDGRVYRPRDCERLVLYLKDINLPRPDKYDTCMLIAFLQQLQTFGGFYDENLEFLRLERVQVKAISTFATLRLGEDSENAHFGSCRNSTQQPNLQDR